MPTINDIANACGLSKATVSLVINNSDLKVSAKTRARVMQAVREMNYRPSAHARSLSLRKSSMIGIVTPHHSDLLELSYYSALISSMVDTAQQMGQTVALYNGRIWKDEEERTPVFGDGRCDGLVVISDAMIPGLQDAVHMTHMPYVMVNSGERRVGINSINIDNARAAHLMTHFLIEKGHRRIAYLHAATNNYYSQERLVGYKVALEEAGIAFDERLVLPGLNNAESAAERAIAISSHPELGVTALFCATDRVALWAMHALIRRGVRVPEDISICGVDDVPEGAMVNPPLTTISQSFRDMGDCAVRLLLELIDTPEQPPRSIIHPAELIARESVAEIKSNQ